MIAYVDTSVVIKLVVDERGSVAAEDLWNRTEMLVATDLTEVEARSALGAAHRSGRLSDDDHRTAKRSLGRLLDQVLRVDLDRALIASAADLAETQGLRGYDAVHLAGALAVADVLASADADLCAAAIRLRLLVANPLDGA